MYAAPTHAPERLRRSTSVPPTATTASLHLRLRTRPTGWLRCAAQESRRFPDTPFPTTVPRTTSPAPVPQPPLPDHRSPTPLPRQPLPDTPSLIATARLKSCARLFDIRRCSFYCHDCAFHFFVSLSLLFSLVYILESRLLLFIGQEGLVMTKIVADTAIGKMEAG